MRKPISQLTRCFKNMRNRCYNPNSARYEHYGARGITVCPEWRFVKAFRVWAVANGYKEGLSLDRIDANGNYCPANCRWIPYEDNHLEMMERNLKLNTGIFSPSSQLKSKQSLRDRYGHNVFVSKGDIRYNFGSIGEAADFLSDELGRKRSSVKSQIVQCLSGKCGGIGDYTIT